MRLSPRGVYHRIRQWQDDRFVRRLSQRLRVLDPVAFARLTDQVSRYRSEGALAHPLQVYKLWELERTLRELTPLSILELGTGSSTPVFAEYVLGTPGACMVALDENEHWLGHTEALLPEEARATSRVRLVHSPRQVVQGPQGVEIRYSRIPDDSFDFVFVDGPSLQGTDGRKIPGAVNTDVMGLLERAPPATIAVDMRRDTVKWFAETFGSRYEARISHRIQGRRTRDYQYLTLFHLRTR